MQPERFAYDTTDAVALDRTARRPDGHRQSETRTIEIVVTRSHGEEPIPHAPAARVYSLEVRLPPQAPLRGKSESLGTLVAVFHRPCASARRTPDARGHSFKG